MEIGTWIQAHWPEMVAALGIGGGGGYLGKKITDHRQDDQLNDLAGQVKDMDIRLTKAEHNISTNTSFDKQFREDQLRFKEQVDDMFREIREGQRKIMEHLLKM